MGGQARDLGGGEPAQRERGEMRHHGPGRAKLRARGQHQAEPGTRPLVDEQTKQFDALTDAGLLTRKAEEKKRFLVGSKQVNDYDLSEQGRAKWTADASQPGYGNFCYGHAEVTSIDGYTPATDDGTQYTVNYHYSTSSLPGWVNSAEMKTASSP